MHMAVLPLATLYVLKQESENEPLKHRLWAEPENWLEFRRRAATKFKKYV